MNTPEKCPKCGDPLKDGWDNVYQCGSAFYTEGPLAGRIREHHECIRLQRDQLAERVKLVEIERDELKVKVSFDELTLQKMDERVKRLEEAGRELARRHLLVVVTYPRALDDVAAYEKAIQ